MAFYYDFWDFPDRCLKGLNIFWRNGALAFSQILRMCHNKGDFIYRLNLMLQSNITISKSHIEFLLHEHRTITAFQQRALISGRKGSRYT